MRSNKILLAFLLILTGTMTACGGNPWRSHNAAFIQRENYCLQRGASPDFCREYAKNQRDILVQREHECDTSDPTGGNS